MDRPLSDALLALAWSLFTELGVPGVVREHQTLAVDPEPLVVWVPTLFALDPRLRDQVYAWCVNHGERLSVSRLNGLAKQLPSSAATAFHGLAATLRQTTRLRWPSASAVPWVRTPDTKARELPIERPGLLRFRARTLSGVGARADVLCELLAHRERWFRASELAGLGYSKRAVAGILAELAQARIAEQQAAGNAWTYRLANPKPLESLLAAEELVAPDWMAIQRLVLTLAELDRLGDAPPTSRRIEANKLRERLLAISQVLRLPPPPATRGNASAYADLLRWSQDTADGLATGRSPAFRA